MATEIGLNNIVKYYAAEKVLHHVSFSVNTGEKIGIVGENGSGKTTLFKIIAGLEGCDGGSLTIRKGATIGLLDQIPVYPEKFTALDVLNTAFTRQLELRKQLTALEKEMSASEPKELEQVLKSYSSVQIQFETLGGYQIDEKRARICTGLKLEDALVNSKFSSLSGGEKTVICVAKMLLESPDVLLLDEPSNHLDIEAVEWLENYLNEYPGTVLIISHDRYFLNKAVKKIIEIDNGEAEIYHGNYSYYTQERERRLLAQFEDYTDQQKKIKAMEQTIKRFREWGTQGDNPKFFRKAASLQKQMDKMEKLDRPQLERDKIKLNLTAGQRTGEDVLQVRGIYKSFAGQKVLRGVTLHIRHGEKTAIVGNNGCGKTTLFKLIMGAENPDQGEVKLGARAQVGYLEQDVIFPAPEVSILETFRDICPMSEGQARSILAKFLFYGEDVFKPVGILSGGERSRLRLCQLMHQDINVLFLDEPTNHLDIPAREMLEQALLDFNGTLVFVSHDRYFVNRLAERVIELKNGQVTDFLGNYDYYRIKAQEQKGFPAEAAAKPKQETQTKSRVPRVNTYKVQALEARIGELEARLKEASQQMEVNAADYLRLEELQETVKKLEQELEEAWEELAALE